MLENPFSAYYSARNLESILQKHQFLSVFSSSYIKVYPYQVAAAGFALNSSLGGAVLCDESGMGKSHEALLVVADYFHKGFTRSLILIPNADLLEQWVILIEDYYSIPYSVVLTLDCLSYLEEDCTILSTYDFVCQHIQAFQQKFWDLCVFEEATALSSVYKEDNKQGKILKELAKNSFKLLLTGTPIEKNIMDLYGLIYFIDDAVLPQEDIFLKRYLRKPENYPELSEKIRPYSFRTLRYQAKQYAKIPERRHVALEFIPSKKEQDLYQKLFSYCNQEEKLAFPSMNPYDLSLKLLGTLSSSTMAVRHTLQGIIKRVELLEECDKKQTELQDLEDMYDMASEIVQSGMDEKTKLLKSALVEGFQTLKLIGAREKAVIFTESLQTQDYLYACLSEDYSVTLYHGGTDYSALKQVKTETQILISNDHGARGFNLEEVSFLIQYDLLYNTLKMEQRIDRCHRLDQEFHVIALSFVNITNLSDVRKIELVNKRIAVSDGVLGISDNVIGGFTEKIDFSSLKLPRKEEIETEFQQTLHNFQEENQDEVSTAEDILFTTFTPAMAEKLDILPSYAHYETESKEINKTLWDLTHWFFRTYNKKNTDCFFEIDEENKTITATNYEKLPILFYYYSGSQNRKYISQKQYGMGKDFKPRKGRITLTSILGLGILRELECGDGTLFCDVPESTLALYQIFIQKNKIPLTSYPLWTGKGMSNNILSHEECKRLLSLPTGGYEMEDGSPFWLKTSSKYDPLDELVDEMPFILKHHSPTDSDEELQLLFAKKKADLYHALEDLRIIIKNQESHLKELNSNKMAKLKLQREVNQKKLECRHQEELLFFKEKELEEELQRTLQSNTGELTAKIVRQCIVTVKKNE